MYQEPLCLAARRADGDRTRRSQERRPGVEQLGQVGGELFQDRALLRGGAADTCRQHPPVRRRAKAHLAPRHRRLDDQLLFLVAAAGQPGEQLSVVNLLRRSRRRSHNPELISLRAGTRAGPRNRWPAGRPTGRIRSGDPDPILPDP